MRWSRPAVVSVVLALWAFSITIGAAVAQQLTSFNSGSPHQLITNGGYLLTRDQKILARYNEDSLFIPASTIKIATALTALEILGPAHRFKTEFYLRHGTTLCIKGYGDPYLISERIGDIAATLKKKGLSRVEKIIVDDHYFSLDGPADGSENSANPYDARNGALSVNFNSIALARHADGSVTSAEPQTPMLTLTADIGSLICAGSQRVNVSAYTARNESITPLRYAAELFAQMLRNQGVVVAHAYGRGKIDRRDRLIYTYYSEKTLADMLRGCLEHSNNFIANQIFLSLGAVRFGPPATWEKARRALAEVLAVQALLDETQYAIVEGSGLSKKNRITPAAMIQVLETFRPYADLLPRRDGILRKSGTMSGVYAYSGYFNSGERLDPFVILLNQSANHRDLVFKNLATIYQNQRESP